jgi:hypothetical protein
MLEDLENRCLLSTSIPLSSSHWTPLGPAPIQAPDHPGDTATGRVSAIAADPTNANVIYVGAASGGVWKTTNGGQTWFPLTDSQDTLNIGAIAIAPSSPNVIYAGTGESNFSGDNDSDTIPGQGVLKSTTAGATWTLLGQSWFAGASVSAIVVNPTNPDIVYAATADGGNKGVYKSIDGGQTWSNTFLGAPFGASVSALVMDPTDPGTLYAAAGWYQGNASNGVYRFRNGDTSWSRAGNFPTDSGGSNHVGRVSLAIARSAPGTLYAAIADPSDRQDVYEVLKTTNGNTTNPGDISWQVVGTRSTFNEGADQLSQLFHGQGYYGNVIVVDPFIADDVFVAGYKVFKSTDGGGHWIQDPNTPLKIHDDQHAFAFTLPNDPINHKLLVGTDGGIFRLDNPSNFTFSNLNGTGLQITQFYHIALDPTTANIAYGASQDNGVEEFNDNRTWTNELGGDGNNVEVSATNHNRVYWSDNGTFYRSDNGSYAAFATPNGSRSDLYVLDPNNGDRILMGGNAVYESTNAGMTGSWTPRNGVGWPASVNAYDENLAVSPTSPNTTYFLQGSATSAPGTYVTTDDGLHWQHYNAPGNDDQFWGLTVDPLNSQVAYALSHAGHVYRTTNGGQTWPDITGNLPQENSFSIAVKANGPADRDHVVYVGNDTGVYATCDMGATWSRVSTGLPNAHVTHVEVLPNRNVLAAGTYGRGLWELQIGVVAQVQNRTLNISADDCPNVITITRNPDLLGLNVWEGNSSTPFNHLVGFFPAASFDQVTLTEGNGNDIVNIEDTLSGQPLTVNLGNGIDAVNVSPFANNLDHIQGTVAVNGGNGLDTLNINDQNKASNLTYTLDAVSWSRPGSAVISSGTLFANVNQVVVNAGSGANTYNTRTSTRVTLNTGPGQGTVNVLGTGVDAQGTGLPLLVDTPSGTLSSTQTVTVGEAGSLHHIGGPVTIHNQPAFDNLTIDDSNGPVSQPNNVMISANGVTGLAPAPINFTSFSVGALTIKGGTGDNISYTVANTPAAASMLLNTGSGPGAVAVRATSVPLSVDTPNGNGHSSQTITVTNGGSLQGVQGSIAIRNLFAFDTLIVDDSTGPVSRPSNVLISRTEIAGLAPAGISWLTTNSVGTLTVTGGTGSNNNYSITDTGPNVTFNTGTGGNTVNVQGTSAALVVNASQADTLNIGSASHTLDPIETVTVNDPTGTSAVTLDDAGNGGSPEHYAVTTSAVTVGRLQFFALSYNGSGTLKLKGGQSSDSFDLSAGTSATAITLQGGAASNTLTGSNAGNSWEVTGADTGTLGGPAYPTSVAFNHIGDLTAGSGGDYFLFDDQATLSGTLTGGGSDTLDYTPYSSSVIVDLQTQPGFATGIAGGVSGILNLTGGNGAGGYNILVGSGGNLLTGGNGRRNLLIAGPAAASTLIGGDGEDILIAGWTAYDTNLVALQDIMNVWTGGDPLYQTYADRVNRLTNDATYAFPLNPGTVQSNGGGNTLTGKPGGSPALDLYFANLGAGDMTDATGLDAVIGIS